MSVARIAALHPACPIESCAGIAVGVPSVRDATAVIRRRG